MGLQVPGVVWLVPTPPSRVDVVGAVPCHVRCFAHAPDAQSIDQKKTETLGAAAGLLVEGGWGVGFKGLGRSWKRG